MKTKIIDTEFEAHDIYELTYTRTGFRAIITGFKVGTEKYSFLEIFFPVVQGFRCLDEGDFIKYWESEQFTSENCLYEILEDGWLEENVHGILSVSSAVNSFKEFLITSQEHCVNILTTENPEIRIYDDPYPLT